MSSLVLRPNYSVELIEERNKHFYDVRGEKNGIAIRLPGVTGFLDVINRPALLGWVKREALACVETALLKRMDSLTEINEEWIKALLKEAKQRPERIKDDAADLGTKAHAFINLIIHGKEPDSVPAAIEAPIKAFKQWWKNSGIELVLGDTKVASLKYGYGGSLDALGRREGKFVILDWKTSNGIWREYSLQVSAYAQAFYETFGIYCQEGIVVRFGKKVGKKAPVDFEAKKVANLEKSFQAFLAAKALKESLELDHFLEAV